MSGPSGTAPNQTSPRSGHLAEFEHIASEAGAKAYIEALLAQHGVPHAEKVLPRLALLTNALAEENTRQNLVSAASLDAVWQRHIADSAQLLEHVPRETRDTLEGGEGAPPWLDLGTGAGFPGLVIAAIFPQWPVLLVESRKRRVTWLEDMTQRLGLPNCRVLGQRLEQTSPLEAGVISARAFAPLKKLLRLSAPFSTAATIWLLPKGRMAAQELEELPAAQRKMFHVELSRTSLEAGILVGQGKSAPK